MTFTPGNKLSKGRPPGARNKRTSDFLAVLEEKGFCPATALMDIYKTALEKFIEESEKESTGRISPMESQAAKYLKIAADNASDLAGYAYPKLKAIERSNASPLDGMSAQEKLEAMRQAVALLEAQVKAQGSGSGAP